MVHRHGWSLVLAAACVLVAGAARADYTLTVLHVNDLHSAFLPVKPDGTPCSLPEPAGAQCIGGAARLASAIEHERKATHNIIVVAAGGFFAGSPMWDRYQDTVVSNLMTRMNFDALTVGASEFSQGSPTLLAFIRAVHFPLLGANVFVQHEPLLKDQIFPISVIERGGARIGLVGYSAEDIPAHSHPSPETQFRRIEEEISPWIRSMHAALGANKVIAISSAGIERDRLVAQHVPDIDVIVGGNVGSSTAPAYATELPGVGGKKVLLVQVGSFGRYLGKLVLTFDNKGELKKWAGAPILLDKNVPEDAAVKTYVDNLADAATYPPSTALR
jgi:5'-nucleotidase/UDP-sugar diphosphatase